MQIFRDKCIRTKVYIQQTVFHLLLNVLTKHFNVQIKSTMQKDETDGFDWFAPIVADAEAGFGGPLNVFELMKGMIEAGAAGVHFEDQLASEKKCGHLGGKVLLPTQNAIRNLIAARLAADVLGVPTVLIARTDADAADMVTSDIDPVDAEFITGERTPEGFFRTKPGIDQAIARGLAYAPYADLVWCETSHPSLEEATTICRCNSCRIPWENTCLQLFTII